MSWRTNGAVLLLRNLGRSLGINRIAASLRGGGYEDRFQAAMLGAIRPGDIVWDVGANVGLYSNKFSDITGSSGRVFAFEPSPDNLRRLSESVAGRPNVTVLSVALGEKEGIVRFAQGDDSLGATSRIVDHPVNGSIELIEIRVVCGDQLISAGEAASPNVVKIDTEGYELDVLRGLRHTLMRKDLRVLCIEMHFGLLKQRGLPHAPSEIESILASSGFSLAWPDASHIIARRGE